MHMHMHPISDPERSIWKAVYGKLQQQKDKGAQPLTTGPDF